MKKVLVTGGSGLVGYGIRSIQQDYPHYDFIFISSKDANLTDYTETCKVFELHKPNYVIHLAANVGGLFKNMTFPVEMFEDNLMMNYNVVKCCDQYNVDRAVLFLSTCIFPDKTTYPIDETMLHNGPPHFSNAGYAYAKRIMETHSSVYNKSYHNQSPKFVNLIPTNIYGPNDNYNLANAHVMPALIHKCYLAKQNNTPFTVAGTGKPLRQFIYSLDVAKLIMWSLENYHDFEPLIVSPDEQDEVSIGDIAQYIAHELDIDQIQFDTSKPDGQYKKTASNKKLKSLYPEFHFTDIRDGIRDSVEWFIENHDQARL